MYLRPGNLFKDFFLEKHRGGTNGAGRVLTGYDQSGDIRISAALAEAKPEERERWRQLGHPVTHTIVQRGKPLAVAGDRLVHGGRMFYVQGVDDAGELGLWIIYYAEERFGGNGK